jgi:hypothetical protein
LYIHTVTNELTGHHQKKEKTMTYWVVETKDHTYSGGLKFERKMVTTDLERATAKLASLGKGSYEIWTVTGKTMQKYTITAP